MPEFLERMVGAGSATIDWVVIFTFALAAIIYFLAPVVGYQMEKRSMLLISLYILVAYGVVVLVDLVLHYLFYLGSGESGPSAKSGINLFYLFSIVKLVIFLAAEGTLVFGLQSLRRGT